MNPELDLHQDWLNEAENQQASQGTEPDIALGREITRARVRAGLTQEQLARLVGATQPAIARFEIGKSCPDLKALRKIAEVTSSQLVIHLEETPA